MRSRTLLLGSVSAIATAAAGIHSVRADSLKPPLPEGFTYSVEGGAIFASPDTSLTDKASYLTSIGSGASGFGGTISTTFHDLSEDAGYHGAFSIGKRLDDSWDIRAGAAINRLIDNTGSASFSAASGGDSVSLANTITTNFAFETADFEVGYTPHLDKNLHLRMFAGLRALHFEQNITDSWDYAYTSGGSSKLGSYAGSEQDAFLGVGPRMGFEGAKRFDGSRFGLSGMVAAALAFGHLTQNEAVVVTGTSGGSGSGIGGSAAWEATTDAAIFDIEGKAGIDYYLDDKNKLAVGYRAEGLLNIPTSYLARAFSYTSVTSKLTHGPFIQLSGSF